MVKVSIIIPMYNEELYIWRCLESLKKQSFNDFEIILIDDGSKDKTIEIAKSFQKDLELRILQQEHWWPWKARNWWAKKARWEILVFVDADMYFDKDYIKKLIPPIINNEEVWTSHWVELIWNIENIWAKTWWINRITKKEKRSTVYRAFDKQAFFNSWWYDNDRFAFEDHIWKKIWDLALVIDDAICYHNNPTNLKEAFNHEIWMWESLVAKWKLNICFFSIVFLIVFWIIALILYFFNIKIYTIVLFFFIMGLLLLELIWIKKMFENIKYIKDFWLKNKWCSLINYLWSFPILSIVRLFWYLYGICKSFISKK